MLRARLLGALEVELDGVKLQPSASQRPWALFAYLALAGRQVSRAELVGRFWPDVLDQSARASLRSALWALRRQLGDAVAVDGDVVALRHDEVIWVDVKQFEMLAAREPAKALELCRGELLEGVEDEWAMAARDRHRERVIELLEVLARDAERRGDAREAVELSRRQTERDPLDEAAHRRLLTRLANAGDRAAAVRTYKNLAERMRRELGVAPAAQTRELAERLREDEPASSITAASTNPPAPPMARKPRPTTEAPLVGRDHELGTLIRAWQAAAAGHTSVAVVHGEAGIGKSRLASELQSQVIAAGGLAATCASFDLGGTAPLSLWAELLAGLLPHLPAPPAQAGWPEDLAVLVPELPAHFGRASGAASIVAPDLQQTRLFESVVALLDWATRQAPLLLVLEDVNSADAPSLELIAYAARRITGLRVMMLLTRRALPRSPGADRLEQALRARGLLECELELHPLAPDPIAALARETAPLSDRAVRRVVERAEGNPLFAVESARALARGHDEVASSLRGSVRATLAQTGADTRSLIEFAAVAARALEPATVRLLPFEDPEEAASAAIETGLLQSADDRVGFRHALLRDAVYQEIAEPRRRSLHQRWAHILLASEQQGATGRPAEVARQLRLAHADREAVPQLARAAAQARSLAALEQAVAYLEEALELVPDQPELWLELGEVEAWRSRREHADRAFAQAIELLQGGDPLPLARAWLQVARAYHGPICVPRVVRESAGKALELLDGGGLRAAQERSEALAAAAWTEAVAGSIEEAERLLSELSAHADDRDDRRTYNIGHARGLALMRRGRFSESYGPSIAAGEAISRAGRPDLAYGCWANVASAAMAAGEHERALEFLDRGTAAVNGHGLQGIELHLLSARSFVLRNTGRLVEAREVCSAEEALAARLDQPELLAMVDHDRGMVELEAGSHELAAELLERSLSEQAPVSRPQTRLALAEALARSGRPDAAARQVRETVLEPIRPSDFPDALVPRLARVQGLIALVRDDRDEAQRRLGESVAGWERLLERTLRADSITRVLADLGRPVVGLIDPDRELARARADLETAIDPTSKRGAADAVVP